MARTERIFYILEQVRLCLERKDYIRCCQAPAYSSMYQVPPSQGLLHAVLLSCVEAASACLAHANLLRAARQRQYPPCWNAMERGCQYYGHRVLRSGRN